MSKKQRLMALVVALVGLGVVVFTLTTAWAEPVTSYDRKRSADVQDNRLNVNVGSTVQRQETTGNLSPSGCTYSTAFSEKVLLSSVWFHANAKISESLTISVDSKTGATYDIILRQEDLSSNSDVFYSPNGKVLLEDGDEIKVECSSTATDVNYYITVVGEKVQ